MSKTDKEKLVLPKEVRMMMVSSLESANVVNADALSDEEILKQYNEYVLNMQHKVSNYETSTETKNINRYTTQYEHKLQNKEFIMRLFKLNVPAFYLPIFKDEHMELNDRELWQLVNKSGIDPLKDNTPLFKMRRGEVRPKIF